MGDGNWKSYRSKKDQTQSISQSIFLTNFPDHVMAHNIWKVCNDYGIVVDAFIPYKKSKAGNLPSSGLLSESSDDKEDTEDDGLQSRDKVTTNNDVERVSESSCMHNNELFYDNNHNNIMPDMDKVLSDDPFNLYDILNKRKDSGDDLKYPPGFTPSVINVEEVNKNVKGATSNKVNEHVNSSSNMLEESVHKGKFSSNNNVCSKRVHTGGSILQLMDELVKVGQTIGYNMEGCMRNIEVIIGSQGECNVETKIESMKLVTIKTMWGNSSFNYALSSSLGNSGGLLCVWEPTLFVKYNVNRSDNFLAVMGTWVPSSSKLLIISVYAPQNLIKNRVLWDYILHLIDQWDGDYVIMGDFNEVRTKQERYGLVFNVQGDENTKFFHGILNSKRSQLAICETLVDGEWIVNLLAVKSVLLNYFFTQFSSLVSYRICFVDQFTNRLSLKQQADLERNASNEEKIVRYRMLLEHDIVAAVKEFFASVPSGLLKLLESIRRNFFNGVDESERKMIWISRNKLFGEDDAFNSPSSLSKRSPWSDIIREVTVLRTKDINLLELIRKNVGNGLNTLFWVNPWLDDLALKHKFPRLYALNNYKQITVVEKINHSSMVDTFRRPPRGGAEEEQLGFLLSRMDGLILTSILDRWVWSLEATFHLDKLSTRLNLSLKDIDISTIVCPLCHASVESDSYIYFSCLMACHLWRKLMCWWELEDIDLASYDDWLPWLNSSRLSKRMKEILEAIPAYLATFHMASKTFINVINNPCMNLVNFPHNPTMMIIKPDIPYSYRPHFTKKICNKAVGLKSLASSLSSARVSSNYSSTLPLNWRNVQGLNNWDDLIQPLNPLLQCEIIRYGKFVTACYDAFDLNPNSGRYLNCKYGKKRMFSEVGLGDCGYEVTKYVYATANISIPIQNGGSCARWVGYIAVSSDEEVRRIGRRDVLVTFRGTVTYPEWIANLMSSLSPAMLNPNDPKPDIMVEAGFLSLYTSSETNVRFGLNSCREQLLSEVSRLLKKHKHEELSITIVGHSMGSSLALLLAYDVAEVGLKQHTLGGLTSKLMSRSITTKNKDLRYSNLDSRSFFKGHSVNDVDPTKISEIADTLGRSRDVKSG
ncbi:RNA-directed DNA polymerase, eukaryota [Tanacetum coccineum]